MTFAKNKLLLTVMAVIFSVTANASSHREAPFITQAPKVDGTDFYMFNSYEAGRGDFVTLLANYIPLQDAYGGPNYFTMDDDAIYEIHIDNNADAVEDITFQFKFDTVVKGISLNVDGVDVAIPLAQAGGVGPDSADTGNLNVTEFYSVNVIRGDRRTGTSDAVSMMNGGATTFTKPVDNIGKKTLPQYMEYANSHIYDVAIPGCGMGKVFVGQRKEGFVVNLGETFDLINTNPLGPANGELNTLADKNVTTLALEVEKSCLTSADNTIIGAWTTASKRQARILNPSPNKMKKGGAIHGGAYTQVSRLGSPLVNEVVIGLPDKDRFNHSEPKDDGQFATYVTNPTLPELIEILYPAAVAPNSFPRNDLVAGFLTGVSGLNQPSGVVASEMLRLNTAIDAVAAADQEPLAVLAGDIAGFPNGRRPGDDVVDIALRVVMGVLLPETDAPAGQLPFTDGAYVDANQFDAAFPYLKTPLPGSPN
ncbi:MAG: DUF4331 domain-containing protein [Gammaproteobacteria bacterium]|nr:DUF4331 domain-containing protein [Gammaproteobacteria bacterium]NNM14896.1 DUF4331 domain-containing protein [Gammaproteobacteria bacterium]